jgi:hypothetical protein
MLCVALVRSIEDDPGYCTVDREADAGIRSGVGAQDCR